MRSVFDYVGSINSHKYIDDLSDYKPFVVNRALSFSADCILFVNVINAYPNLPERLQYDFLFHSIRPKKRFDKWVKDKKSSEQEDLAIVQEYFGYGIQKAREALTILTSDNLQTIRDCLIKGGEKKK